MRKPRKSSKVGMRSGKITWLKIRPSTVTGWEANPCFVEKLLISIATAMTMGAVLITRLLKTMGSVSMRQKPAGFSP